MSIIDQTNSELATSPPIWEEVLAFFKTHFLGVPLLFKGPKEGWRCRAKLAVRGTPGKPLIGLFKEGTHEVQPIPFCPAHHPRINEAVEKVQQFIEAQYLPPYEEQTHTGDLRYLQFVIERQTGRIQVSFVLNFKEASHQSLKHWQSQLSKLWEEAPELWHSFWINFNDQPTNTIFGSNWKLCFGEELLWERFGEVWVCYQPASFSQANLDLFETMLGHMSTWIMPQAKLAEFYAGVGVIGLYLASTCQWVRCAEINPHAQECFEWSKNRLMPEIASKIFFWTGSANHLLKILQEADVVLADPPRKGLDKDVLNAINSNLSLKQFIYMSCGWNSFKRDCEVLLEAGWKLKDVNGYIFFPGSDHIEILADFRKESG